MTRSRDKRDIYYRKAKEEGYRARSAFKLLQLDDEFGLFDGVSKVVDLCAAPGSWSQVCSARLGAVDGAKLVAVDLQEMAPIPGVTILQGDITQPSTVHAVVRALESPHADLVISDGAPDVTGLHDLDEYVQLQLIMSALNVVHELLRPGGTFVAKVFRQRDADMLYGRLNVFFPDVTIAKPRASRNSSIEAFVVCRGYQLPEGFIPPKMGVEIAEALTGASQATRVLVPFLACGDLSGFDPDRHYDLDSELSKLSCSDSEPPQALQPVQGPINPPYQRAQQFLADQRQNHLR